VRGSGYLLPDLSGRGNHGVLQNMDAGTDWPGAAVRGVHGRVLDCDGSNDQAVTALALPAASSRTVAMWVLARTTANYCFGTNFGFSNSGLFLGIEVNLLTVTQFGATIRDTTTFPANVWQHICTAHVGNSYRLYRNGVLVNSGTMTTTPVAAVAYLGSYGGGGYFNGQIGESLFFQRAISDAEVHAIYRQGNGAIGRQLTGQTQRRVYGFVPAGFKPYWARRQNQIIGGGV